MGKKHQTTDMDRARDQLMSLIHRCDVMKAEEAQRNEWLKETVELMAEQYPSLSKMELANLELIGRRFCAPAIAHGAANTALSRGEEEEESQESEAVTKAEDELQVA